MGGGGGLGDRWKAGELVNDACEDERGGRVVERRAESAGKVREIIRSREGEEADLFIVTKAVENVNQQH